MFRPSDSLSVALPTRSLSATTLEYLMLRKAMRGAPRKERLSVTSYPRTSKGIMVSCSNRNQTVTVRNATYTTEGRTISLTLFSIKSLLELYLGEVESLVAFPSY